MPRVIVTQGAVKGLSVCQQFLETKNPQAAKRAAASIAQYFLALETTPEMGRPLADEPKLQEGIIPFGETGYVALYHFDQEDDVVYILAFRHQKAAGYAP